MKTTPSVFELGRPDKGAVRVKIFKPKKQKPDELDEYCQALRRDAEENPPELRRL